MTKAPVIMLARPSKPPRRARSFRREQTIYRASGVTTGLESLLVPTSSAEEQNSGETMAVE